MKLTSPLPSRRLRIVVIPLIDIMFFLLASFMMMSLQMSRTPIHLERPNATSGRSLFNASGLNIAVDRAGNVWVEDQRLSPAELVPRLEHELRGDGPTHVYISGDHETLQATMIPVLRALHAAGVESISFLVGGTPDQAEP
jgi:biopolymer transport protein ExbD